MDAGRREGADGGVAGGRRPIGLTIAGFDPLSGAGVTADLKVFAAHRLYGAGAITALTVQSTLGVRRSEPVAPGLLRDTLQCLSEDVQIAGVKIGMLGSAENAQVVADWLANSGVPRSLVVLDPVLRSTSGAPLLGEGGLASVRTDLLARVGWITPNRHELAVLTGGGLTESRQALVEEARRLRQMAAVVGNSEIQVVVTGGDLARPDDLLLTSANGEPGAMAPGVSAIWLAGEHVDTTSTHGTGCAFSTALLCELIRGEAPYEAAVSAKAYVAQALKRAYPVGHGHGPMNHLFRFEGE